MHKYFRRGLTAALALLLLLSQSVWVAAADKVDSAKIFKNMPTSEDLSKPFNGRMPDWVHFPYEIDVEASLWTTDTEDTFGLVYLDTYKLNAETGEYEAFHIGRYPGHMKAEGFTNYGPPYGEQYYPKNVCMPGQYRSTWRVPIFGTNTEDATVYDYAEYTVDFEITLPGIFTSVPNLSREADGTPAETADPTFDLALSEIKVDDAAALTTAAAWFAYNAEADDMLGEALEAAPSEEGAYVYRFTVSDGSAVVDTLYCYFELSAPKLFYRLGGPDSVVFTNIPPVQVYKEYDGTPVTVEDFAITYDLSLVDKAGESFEESTFWWMPDANGNYTRDIAGLEGGMVGPSEPGSYNLQFCLNGDNVEAYFYSIFTIAETEEPGDTVDYDINFFDVDTDDWFYDAVMFVTNEAHLFQGVGEGYFAPEAGMNAAMLATVLHRMMGLPNDTQGAESWYADGLAWALDAGMLPAFDADAEAAVTRQKVIFALYACAHDGALPSGFAQAMEWAVEQGIIVGDDAGELLPEEAVTRAQVAQILMGYLAD